MMHIQVSDDNTIIINSPTAPQYFLSFSYLNSYEHSLLGFFQIKIKKVLFEKHVVQNTP